MKADTPNKVGVWRVRHQKRLSEPDDYGVWEGSGLEVCRKATRKFLRTKWEIQEIKPLTITSGIVSLNGLNWTHYHLRITLRHAFTGRITEVTKHWYLTPS